MARTSHDADAGFTLLELLVSMVILGVIVVICGRIFEHSSAAWDSGSRRAELNLTGRSIVDLMVQEISQAVDDGMVLTDKTPDNRHYITNLVAGASWVQFLTLEDSPSNAARTVRWVEYKRSGDVVSRTSQKLRPTDQYSLLAWRTESASLTLAESVTNVLFFPYFDGPGLPRYIDVVVQLSRPEDTARRVPQNWEYRSRAHMHNARRGRFE